MIKLLVLLGVTSISLLVGVVVFLGVAWLVVAIPVVLLCGGGSCAVAVRRRVLARRPVPAAANPGA
jgi:hypothetical protein